MLILAMDVGLINMGLVFAQVSTEDFSIDKIIDCRQIDIKGLVEFCDDIDCPHSHSRCIADYMSHLFSEYKTFFERADTILVERQPPQGFISIQEITNYEYRDKVVMIAPQGMHNYFDMQGLTYDRRKEFTVEYAKRWLGEFPDFSLERNHDISDAMCMIIYHLKALENREILSRYAKAQAPVIKGFEEYRYTGT